MIPFVISTNLYEVLVVWYLIKRWPLTKQDLAKDQALEEGSPKLLLGGCYRLEVHHEEARRSTPSILFLLGYLSLRGKQFLQEV